MRKLAKKILAEKDLTRAKIEWIKRAWARESGAAKIPLNSELLPILRKLGASEDILRLFRTKPAKSISGVTVIAIMAKPARCPGACIYCPRGENTPQSYTGYEPAAMRARRNLYDPYKQVRNRLAQLEAVGHPTAKCELIVMGGTFLALPWSYQKWFIQRAFDAFNGMRSRSLAEAHKKNEHASRRVVGLTIETRPDWVDVQKLLKLGTTRVELGVQTVYDEILTRLNRGHSTEETILATQILKDAGFKVLYHIMPGLPGSNTKKDLFVFKKIFSDQRFRPDMLKVYPTLVLEGTKLNEIWKAGEYQPLEDKDFLSLMKKVMAICPKWIRIMRMQRDIPAPLIQAGPKKSNIRQILDRDVHLKEIRHRELGHVWLRSGKLPQQVELVSESYKASWGREIFLSAEDVKQDILVGFLRLRLAQRAFVRELHVYGAALPLDAKARGPTGQHRGWGRRLLAEAERFAAEKGYRELWVISGVGVRAYYRKLGYALKSGYMVKKLKI